MNSDGFIFDQDIIAQVVAAGYSIAEIPVPTRYFPEEPLPPVSGQSIIYGLKILWLVVRYLAHHWKLLKLRQFESLRARYTRLSPSTPPSR